MRDATKNDIAIEAILQAAGFEWVAGLPDGLRILQRTYYVSQVRGLLRARLRREGAIGFDKLSVVYGSNPELVSLYMPSKGFVMDYPAPQHLYVLCNLPLPQEELAERASREFQGLLSADQYPSLVPILLASPPPDPRKLDQYP